MRQLPQRDDRAGKISVTHKFDGNLQQLPYDNRLDTPDQDGSCGRYRHVRELP